MKGQKCISGLFQCNQEFMRFSGQKEQYFGARIYKQRKIWKISKKFPFCPEILMIKSINRPKYSRFSGQKGSSDLQSPFVLKKFREILYLYFGEEKGTLEMSKIFLILTNLWANGTSIQAIFLAFSGQKELWNICHTGK